MTELAGVSPVGLALQSRFAYLHDVGFHHEVDVAVNIWRFGTPPEHLPLAEYRNLVTEAIAIALWHRRCKDEDHKQRIAQIAEQWLKPCGACDGGLPMSCSCAQGDPRSIIGELIAMLERTYV